MQDSVALDGSNGESGMAVVVDGDRLAAGEFCGEIVRKERDRVARLRCGDRVLDKVGNDLLN